MQKLILAVAGVALAACNAPTAADPCAGVWYDTTQVTAGTITNGDTLAVTGRMEWVHIPYGCDWKGK